MTEQSVREIGKLECTIVRQNELENPSGLVVLCHGFGAPGTDLVPIGAELMQAIPQLGNVIFAFPKAPIVLEPGFDARAWWNIDMEELQRLMMLGQLRDLRSEKPENLETCRNMLLDVISELQKEFAIAPSNTVIGGFSQGAMLSTDVALNISDAVGGLILWSGTLLNESEWRSQAGKNSSTIVVQSHGTMDPVLPFAGATLLKEMLEEFDYSVEFIEFAGQHSIPMEPLVAAGKLMVQICCHSSV